MPVQSIHFRSVSLAACVLASGMGAGAAHADQSPAWYMGVLGGVNVMESTESIYNGPLGEQSDIFDFKTGFGGGALAGYDFGSLRLQGDVIYRRNKVGAETYAGDPNHGVDASVASVAPMLSVLYDIETGTGFTPYVGAGLGAAHVKLNYIDGNGIYSAHGSTWSVAYQGVAGVNYDLTPKLLIGVEYRYFATPDADFDRAYSDGYDQKDFETTSHSLFVGLTYSFGEAVPAPAPLVAAAPPAPPPPAAELARSYLVFFDWNSASVTAEAAAIINEAAKAAGQLAVTRVELTGHADRSGMPAYNQTLSEKRGAAVRNALVQLGIPAADITVLGKGEASPLVPTSDGMREPQNRRVEIVLP